MVKKVTIEDLAGMVQRGFEGVDVKLVNMEKRFDQRFDRIEKLLEQLKHLVH